MKTRQELAQPSNLFIPFIMETYQPTLQALSAKLNRLKKIMHMTASVDTNVFFFLNLRNV